MTEERSEGSVVSYPKRDNRFGDARYRGNCDGRVLLNLLRQYEPLSVIDPMHGSGTSRDVVDYVRKGAVSYRADVDGDWDYPREKDIDYWGSDLREGFDLLEDEIPMDEVELCFLHPPYHNMVVYSDKQNDLSNCGDYEEFREKLTVCLRRCFESLALNGRLAVLVGDLRKRGTYTPIVRDVLNLEGSIGALRSIVVKVQHNVGSDRKSYNNLEDARILHEYVAIFKRV